MEELVLRPIGYVRTARQAKFDAPHQPDLDSGEVNQIDLLPDNRYQLALTDLDGFDRIWLVWWFHRNTTWRPRVMPPRGAAKRRGVFATRSPHRPNPIGLTNTPLIAVQGRTLTVGPLDLVDGTPILDIKPYIHTVDAHPESSLGWVAEINADAPVFEVTLDPLARQQLNWLLAEFGIDFTERAFEILRRDPTPHRTRRILQIGENRFRIACGSWRMFFRREGAVVRIESVASGLSDETLAAAAEEETSDRAAHIAFRANAPLTGDQ